tara:strand:+ start:115 stop:318 length:204 start_codon:yes stop_codon:yes gene_type:complete
MDDFWQEYKGDLQIGDLVEIKKGMMLIEPLGPALILDADNKKGLYEIMYTRNNYVIGCGRMEIKRLL